MFEDITKVMILSDMDGTLLDSKKRISDADIAAIKRFRELGGRFTVATGRTIQSFEQFVELLGLADPVIMYNGAAIHDYSAGETLFTKPLPLSAKRIAKEILEAAPELGGEVLRLDGTYVFRNNDYQILHTKLCGITPNYAELDEIADGGWLKVLFSMSPEDMEYVPAFVRRLDAAGVDFVKSSDMFYEMLPAGVSKGSALAEYRKLSGFEDFTFVAVGDFDNDIEMIEEADLGACPANAEGSVKAKAGLVLDATNDESAVAELIGRVIERCGK